MFRQKYPAAWIFHKNSCRTEYNLLSGPDISPLPQPSKEYVNCPVVVLPEALLPDTSFSQLVCDRLSCRQFIEQPLRLQDLANILYAGYGLRKKTLIGNSEFYERTVPSAGGLYPLELYLLVNNVEGLAQGIYHYIYSPGMLENINQADIPKHLIQSLFLNQRYVADASVIVIATAMIERTMKKYTDRGYRYILFEAGHVFQNMNLMATACNVGSLNVAGFFDDQVATLLEIDEEQEIPIYAMAIGVPNNKAENIGIPL